MNVWKIRAAEKTSLDLGKWASGKMQRSAFPLSKSRAKVYRLGSEWTWRVVKFEAQGLQFRILVAYRTDKEQFMATLGLEDAGDMKIVASLEFHGTHPGWHVHYAYEPIKDVPSGIKRGPWVRRRQCVDHTTFGAAGSAFGAAAITTVADVFGLRPANDQGSML